MSNAAYTLRNLHGLALVAGCLLVGACSVSEMKSVDSAAPAASVAAQEPTSGVQPAMPVTDSAANAAPIRPGSTMRIEVDLSARKLHVYDNGSRVETHPVAVGSAQWPTQTGEWTIKQVIFNPEWVPPDESWAEEREPRKSGDPRNPLGQAQLVYDLPRTIHGTNAPASIGKAVSHGSIRMTNAEVVALAKRLMEANGAGRDAAWYGRAASQRTEKQVVDLPIPVPIRVF